MKKIFYAAFTLFTTLSFAQSTVMIALVLEDNKENEYLEKEKNWNIAAQAMVDNDMIAQWSVWKRTPREGDENWAHYYVFRRTTAEQDKNANNFDNWKKIVHGAFKGKSEKAIDKMLGFKGVFKDRRERKFKWVASTGWRGLEWEIGDKAYFHFMTQKNEDFISYENAVWKPIAQQQILDGYRKFWGLAEIISKDESTKALKSLSTHIAFNFMTKKKNENTLDDPTDFLDKKNWEGLLNSRDMMPAEELTLIYSTF
tara:strand:+ start:323 stop:1090 length:768 start_codon:yes stop_codon:yes gene_type:complete